MKNLHHTIPRVYALTTHLETIELHGILEDPHAESPHRRLTVYIDNLVQWESAVCSLKHSWRADSPLHFAASSSIMIELSCPCTSLAVPGSSQHLGNFSGRVIELLDSHSVDIGTKGRVHCTVQFSPVRRVNTPTSGARDNSPEGVMHSLRKVVEGIVSTNATKWNEIADSCHITISVCEEFQDEVNDRRILDLAEHLCKLYKVIPSQPTTFAKAVASEGVQFASLIDKYERLPLENRALKDVANKEIKDYLIVQARCNILMKDLNTG